MHSNYFNLSNMRVNHLWTNFIIQIGHKNLSIKAILHNENYESQIQIFFWVKLLIIYACSTVAVNFSYFISLYFITRAMQ